ncbi:PAS domain-containing sensor histidine kinase [Chitinophaga sp. S165]|uniref:PAS domain-containing sensor histidine kinase n=1 Tax=Chitinophaga sp. S165 TaxID=2135462 RepID=UPI000D87F708|nr:PAS domain-containing sensor histidine kinase [Chitinophaga sp. S165]PWV51597.1 PAS domain S-box-containing protein [Chitinophaga sp. S165]
MKIDHANNWWPAIADAIEEGYIAIDEQDQIVGYNKSALKTLQVSETRFKDPDFWQSLLMAPFAEIAARKEVVEGREIRLKQPDGRHACLRLNGKPLIKDNITGYIITFTDITSWKDIDESNNTLINALDESQRVFKSVFDYSPTGIGLISPDILWLDVNESLAATLGYSPAELKGADVFRLIHPDDKVEARAQVRMLTEGITNTYRAERRYLHKKGHYIWVFLAASKMLSTDGTFRFFIVQMLDVSEAKKLITEAHKKNIVLHATSVDLQQKIRQLQEFNSIIAHNLRGPATALMDSTELLGDVFDEKVRRTMLEHMKTAAGSILGTLNDLKEMIDLQVNKQNFFTSCELEPMIRQVWKLLSPQIEEKDAHLSLNLSVPVINYVKVYLENILFNLINNAITYTRSDVVPEIKIATWNEDDQVVLMVQDNGIGIDLSMHQEQLFRYKKMFHRGYGSNGVGLFKIRNQIRTFGGNIEVKSESGRGSSFYVYFNNRVYTLQQDE